MKNYGTLMINLQIYYLPVKKETPSQINEMESGF